MRLIEISGQPVELGIGLLTSHIYSRIPIKKDRISFTLAARRSYFDIISHSYNKTNSTSADNDKLPDYRLYDMNGSLIIKPTSNDRITISAFHSGDKLLQQQSFLNIRANWGNTATLS